MIIPVEISEKLAWIHRDASTLKCDDLVELKHCLEHIVNESSELLVAVDATIKSKRYGSRTR